MPSSSQSRILASEFGSLFTENRLLIDTRAPVEFEKGSFPAAINLPLMSNSEREQVGTCYAERGQEAAISLGHELVTGIAKEARIEQWISAIKSAPEAALFCFRGGLRSQTTQAWLAERGCHVPIIEGGYKALRRFLIDTFAASLQASNLVVVAGRTGVAKTALLNQCAESCGSSQRLVTIDLEGLANHRGSAFGKRITPQPSQIDFENAIAIAFLKAIKSDASAVAVEDESRLIGRCALPILLQECIAKAPVITVEASLAQRVEHSWQNYILQNHSELVKVAGDDEHTFEVFAASLRNSLENIKKRLGGVRYSELSGLLETAISEHRLGRSEAHKAWIEILLRDYYDPMYDYQLKSKQRRVVFSGDFDAVAQYLQQSPSPWLNA